MLNYAGEAPEAGDGYEIKTVQNSHVSWKVVDFFLKISALGMSWKITLVVKSPGN